MQIDRAKITTKAGNGGNGCISFRREKHVPRGGPNGGDGGRGGNVILEAAEGFTTLIDLKYNPLQRAENGQHGMGKLRNGKDANDLIVKVPIGTIIRDHDTGDQLADLVVNRQRLIVARGGIGGRGNTHFRSSTFQTPRVAEKGEHGEERTIDLEVKLIADVGLIGFPNAGKSTLLSRISAAKPKIADYPFTTLAPNLGVVRIDQDQNFVMADIPGLIEGASVGAGLGHDFLRHVERTKMLIHVVDLAAVDGRDAITDYDGINRELELYNPRLARLPQLIALNKMDLPSAEKNLDQMKKHLTTRYVFEISAWRGNGLDRLVHAAYRLLQRINAHIREKSSPPEVPMVIEIPREKGFEINKMEDHFIVIGNAPKRAVSMTDLENEQAIVMLYRKLKKMGVISALKKAGVIDGDTIKIDDFEFTFTTDEF